MLGADPDPEQVEALDQVSRGNRRISIRSGHGVGKTTLLAWLIVWWICVKFPQKTVCTAPTSKQLFDALAAETVMWIKRLPGPIQELFEIKSDQIELRSAPEQSFVSFRTSRPEVPEALAGVHAPWVLLIADEASGIPEQVYEAAAGSMSGHNACTVLAGNPVRSSGLFFDTHHKLRDMWYTIHISCVGHRRITPDYVADMARRYGEDSNAYRVRVLGDFPKADDDTIIPLELAQLALLRDVRPILVPAIWGVDVARFGSDQTALAKRRGNVLPEKIRSWGGLDTMQTAGRIKAEWDATPPSEHPEEICVDAIGIGAGVADRLRELGLPCRAVNVSESPALTDRYRNLRAELWFLMKEWFAARDCNIANDDLLLSQIVGVKYKITSSGKLQVESKEEIKKRGLPSPDIAEALLMTFAAPATAATYGTERKTSWREPLKRIIRGIV